MDIKWNNLERVLNELGEAVIAKAREKLDANNSNATHNLYDTLEKVVKLPGDDGSISVSISLADYWAYLEYGTGQQHIPDARSPYWPKIEPLKEWVANKPGVPKEESFAYAVRGAIRYGTATHPPGTQPHPFFWPAVEEVLPLFEERIDKAIEQDVADFILAAVEEMFKGWK